MATDDAGKQKQPTDREPLPSSDPNQTVFWETAHIHNAYVNVFHISGKRDGFEMLLGMNHG